MINALNDEQRKLVEEYAYMIPAFLHNRKRGNRNGVDDLYGECAIALCLAAQGYRKDSTTSFFQYAWICLEHRMNRIHHLTHNYIIADSLDERYDNGNKAETHKIYNDSDTLSIDKVYAKIEYEKLLNTLNDRDRDIVNQVLLNDEQLSYMGDKYGISRQRVYSIVDRFKKRLRENFI